MLILILPAGETDGDAIQMAFSKKAVEDRKTWLSNFVPGTFLDSDAATISYSDFVHKVHIVQRCNRRLHSLPHDCPGAHHCPRLAAMPSPSSSNQMLL